MSSPCGPCNKPSSAPNSDISVLFDLTVSQAHELVVSNKTNMLGSSLYKHTAEQSLTAKTENISSALWKFQLKPFLQKE